MLRGSLESPKSLVKGSQRGWRYIRGPHC